MDSLVTAWKESRSSELRFSKETELKGVMVNIDEGMTPQFMSSASEDTGTSSSVK